MDKNGYFLRNIEPLMASNLYTAETELIKLNKNNYQFNIRL